MRTSPASRWPVLLAYAAVAAATQMLWLTFAPVTTIAARHYGVSVADVGWLSEMFPLLYVVLALPAGAVLDRWFRGGLAAGAALTAIGAVLRLPGGAGWVFAGQVLVAVAQPLVLNAVTKVAGTYLSERDRPQGIALGSAGIFVGMVAALVLGAAIGSRIPLLLLVQAAAAVAAAAWLLAVLRRPGRYAAPTVAAGIGAIRSLAGDSPIRLLCVLAFLAFGVFIAVTTWLQALLRPAGVTPAAAGVLLAILVVAGVVGSAVLPGAVAARRREQAFLSVAALVTTAGCAVLAAVPGLVSGAVVFALAGLLLLGSLPVVLQIVERRAGPAAATGAALIWLLGNAGGLVVALAVQALVNRPAAAFALLAAVAGLTAVLTRAAPLRRLHRAGPGPAVTSGADDVSPAGLPGAPAAATAAEPGGGVAGTRKMAGKRTPGADGEAGTG
ncbi:MAG TPA: MFS transporter [Streptosporangiaceae bacterium]|nr:MFS transporter [Streptosporangiaceae bacterium]